MNVVLDIGFVIAVTAFVKQQFDTQGWVTICVAFATSLVAAFLPLFAQLFPAIVPWLDAFIKAVGYTLGACGGTDFIKQLKR